MHYHAEVWHPGNTSPRPDQSTEFPTEADARSHADFVLSDAPTRTAVRITDGQHTLEYRVAEDESSYVHYAPDDYPM